MSLLIFVVVFVVVVVFVLDQISGLSFFSLLTYQQKPLNGLLIRQQSQIARPLPGGSGRKNHAHGAD